MERLPDDLIDWLKIRRRQLRAICPSCGMRSVEVGRTGWCWRCTLEIEAATEAEE